MHGVKCPRKNHLVGHTLALDRNHGPTAPTLFQLATGIEYLEHPLDCFQQEIRSLLLPLLSPSRFQPPLYHQRGWKLAGYSPKSHSYKDLTIQFRRRPRPQSVRISTDRISKTCVIVSFCNAPIAS